MLARAYLSALLLVTVPAFPQVVSPLNSAPAPDSDQMAIPPPVSRQAYPIVVGTEEHSNYLRGGMTFSTGYIDNLYPGGGAAIAETTYSILPTLDLDQTTPLRHFAMSYSPGFTFYQPTSGLNEVDQNATVAYQVRLTPHSALSLSDGFQDSSTSYSTVASGVGGSVSGSIPTIAPGIIAPFAKRLTNNAEGELTVQTSRDGMLGASGTAAWLHYPDPAEVQGLYDSSSRGGSAFYYLRFSDRQYLGASYGYSQALLSPHNAQSDTRTHTFSAFYTIYLRPTLSLSVAAGPQYYRVAQTSLPTVGSWGPSASTSIGWQGSHTSFAAGYAQAVTGGNGLLGAYHSRAGSATGRWQMSPTWTAGVSTGYALLESASPVLFFDSQSGHTLSGSATVQHSINRQLDLEFEYDRIHQSYGRIPAISNNPDSDRVAASISWKFMRPLGQ